MSGDPRSSAVLGEVDPQKRAFVGKLVGTTVFAAPAIASFAMTSLTADEAHAAPNLRE
jgi:hypothetical protein